MNQDASLVWPEDVSGMSQDDTGPDYQLAIVLLAAGMPQSYVRGKCRFESLRQVQAFCRDEETRQAVKELAAERAQRLGKLATVELEKILRTPQTDLRAQVLAIRTALEVSGDLKRDHSPPAKSVRELSVTELGELIAATRNELNARVSRQRDVQPSAAQQRLIESDS
jgi:hypothetical protein